MSIRKITGLDQLPPVPAMAVIINCGTKWFTSLALVSAHRAGLPILLIDCESRDGSWELLSAIGEKCGIDFHWTSWPLRTHGLTLDALFENAPADRILLVDSDVEIEEPATVQRMIEEMDRHPEAYGAGFVHAAEGMGSQHGVPAGIGLYAERMWIPLTLLRTRAVQAALESGASFAQARRFTEMPNHPRLSRWMGMRFFLPGINQWQARHLAEGKEPIFHEYDTGALMHETLRALGYDFVRLPNALWERVHHYHGATRASFRWSRQKLAERLGLIRRPNGSESDRDVLDAKKRLAAYGIEAEA